MAYKRPMFAPKEFARVLDGLGKGDLIDLAWSLAGRLAESADDPQAVFDVLALENDTVAIYRHGPHLRTIANRLQKSDAARAARES